MTATTLYHARFTINIGHLLSLPARPVEYASLAGKPFPDSSMRAEQALPQWPNTVSVGTKPTQAVGGEKPRGGRVGRAMAAVRQRTLGSQPQPGDHVQALWTGYKPVTRPDQQLLDR